MPVQQLDVDARVSSIASWTRTGGSSLADVLSDASDATYARSNAKNVRVVFSTTDPVSPEGRLVSICPFVRSKRPGSLSAKAIVCTYDNGIIVSRGTALAIPKASSAGDHELPAHRGCLDLGSVTERVAAPGGEHSRIVTRRLGASSAALGLVDSSATENRATVYRAYLRAYYMLAATVATPSAPAGTITDTQTPDCTVLVSDVVESWQLPANEEPWLCGGDVEFRVYAAADVPEGATVPPPLAQPVWSTFVRYFQPTWVDGTTPSGQNVTAEPAVLANGDWVLFVRASRDVPDGQRLHWSAWAQAEFTVDVTPPQTPVLTAAANDAAQRVDLALTAATTTGYDGTMLARVQRSDDDGLTWTDVRGCLAVPVAAGANSLPADHEAPRGQSARYRARISDVLTADGTRMESAWHVVAADGPALSPGGAGSACWNLKVPTDPALSWIDAPVIAHPAAELDRPMTIFRPLGRGSAVAVSGAAAIEVGTLEVHAKDAAEVALLAGLIEADAVLLVETAFGEAFYARLTGSGWTRSGTTALPRRPASLQYAQVARPPVT